MSKPPAASLTVTATSSNTTLVPNANIVLGGSRREPHGHGHAGANQIGTTTITLTVSDGTGDRDRHVRVTVTAVNDPPTISDVAESDDAEDTATGALAFTVGDVETAGGVADA